jgi:MFS family permease
MKPPKWVLPIIVISQFCCTSLWFAGNGVMVDLVDNFNLNENALGHLTSAVQFGFISGTLIFALLTIADRFSPSKVFFISALLGALCNSLIIIESNVFLSLLLLRFLIGFFLAGIYPVGMKIAADYYDKKLGKSLGFLVGALVLGTSFPHLLRDVLHNDTEKAHKARIACGKTGKLPG